jgi:uroporphyrinogen-III synthase
MQERNSRPDFHEQRVLAFESRRAKEIAALISTFGGRPQVAPALREVPLESNTAALNFADALMKGRFDIVIFLTGVGTRALVEVIAASLSGEAFLTALRRTRVVARGPKPLAVLRELQVPVWTVVPEPNTWHELLVALDSKVEERPLAGAHIAVQEYGVSNEDLLNGLRERGSVITRVPVYRWMLPEDTAPLQEAVTAIANGDVDVVLFTTSVQVIHLWQIAREMRLESEMRGGITRTVIASIGPSTSDELRRHGLHVDIEPSHPKLGFLVRETAERSGELLRAKRSDARGSRRSNGS